jgi:hypothetical protein
MLKAVKNFFTLQHQGIRKKYLHQKRALKIVRNFNLRSLNFLNPKIHYLTVTVHKYTSEVQITNTMYSFSAETGTHIHCTSKVGG